MTEAHIHAHTCGGLHALYDGVVWTHSSLTPSLSRPPFSAHPSRSSAVGFRIDMRHTVMRYVGEGANEAPGTKRGSGYALLPRSSDGATGGAEKGADEESEGSRR